jgi:hypothetical protein
MAGLPSHPQRGKKTSVMAPFTGFSSQASSLADMELLLRALIEVNIARKNMLSYPQGHHQVDSSSRRAFQYLRALLKQSGELAIGVVREGLIIADQPVGVASSIIKDLVAALRDRRVVRIEIDPGLTLDDTLAFLRLITETDGPLPADSSSTGERPTAVLLNSIRVQFIDYSLFHHIDDLEASHSETQRSIWHDYIRLIGVGALTNSSDGTLVSGRLDPPPEKVAQFINQRAKADPGLLKHFEQVVQNRLQKPAMSPAQSPAPQGVKRRFKQFIENLNPNLKKQFLAIAFDQLQQNEQSPGAEGVLKDLHYSIVIEMLIHANSDGKEISPTLINFVRKMHGSGALQARPVDELDEGLENLKQLQALMPNRRILSREAYEAYVNPDYDETLQALIANQLHTDAPNIDTGPHIESMSERSVTLRLGEAFLGMLKNATHPDLYHEHAHNLIEIVEDLARYEACGLLLEMLRLFRAHSDGKQPPLIDAAARQGKEQLCSPKIIHAVLDPICQRGQPLNAVQVELLTGLGPGLAVEVLDRYLTRKTQTTKALLIKVAAAFPQKLSSELAFRLHSADSGLFMELLSIATLLGTERIQRLLSPFLDHEDRRIQATALAVLVKYKNAAALHRLERLLESRDPKDLRIAIGLLEKYTVREMLPVLIRMVSRGVLLFEADLITIETLIATIQRIANPVPCEELLRVLKWKVSVPPGRLKRIKASLKALKADLVVPTACGALPSPSKCAGP